MVAKLRRNEDGVDWELHLTSKVALRQANGEGGWLKTKLLVPPAVAIERLIAEGWEVFEFMGIPVTESYTDEESGKVKFTFGKVETDADES